MPVQKEKAPDGRNRDFSQKNTPLADEAPKERQIQLLLDKRSDSHVNIRAEH